MVVVRVLRYSGSGIFSGWFHVGFIKWSKVEAGEAPGDGGARWQLLIQPLMGGCSLFSLFSCYLVCFLSGGVERNSLVVEENLLGSRTETERELAGFLCFEILDKEDRGKLREGERESLRIFASFLGLSLVFPACLWGDGGCEFDRDLVKETGSCLRC